MMQRLILSRVLATLATSSLAIAQLSVVVPDGAETNPGNSSNAFPWGTDASFWPGLRLMATYGAQNFTNQNVNFPILISRLKWRPDNFAGARTGGQFAIATIELSTSPVGWAGVTTNYATNHGADRAVVYDAAIDGPVIHTPTPGPGSWTVQSWCVDVQLSSPFLYDPSQGDLVIDVDYPTGSFTGGNVGQMDVQGAGSNSSRVFASSMYPVANGTTQQHGPVVEVDYVPAAGLYSIFSADRTGGGSPLTVNFMDQSYSSSAGGVTGWAWDFDNDGTIDSTLQNPTHTFTNCGSYDVALTVTDSQHSPSTSLRPGLITTDEVEADFTSTAIVPLVVQFTDTTVGPATTWAWDLDGDTVVDSTLRNPTFAYPDTSTVDVTLTVSRLCGPTNTITKTIVPAEKLTTTFQGGASGSDGATVYFDLRVNALDGIEITGFDIGSTSPANTPFLVDVHLTSGGYAGKETAAAAWQFVGTAAGTTSGLGSESLAALRDSVYAPPGDYGVALHYRGAAPEYTVGNQVYANADLRLTLGAARSTAVGMPFGSGTTASPRIWNGAIYYTSCSDSGRAGYGFLGEGCAGSLGIPTLTAVTDPVLGMTLTVVVDRLPTNAALMLTGLSNTTSPFGTLPVNGTGFGAPGCFLRVSPDNNLLLLGTGQSATWNLMIPNDPTLTCVRLFQQAVALDPAANAAGAVMSHAAGFVLGN
ncbi:MAG: PKD domain-containing protein [bacterium]|nr:PKD domain-containing protein [bacterium]